MFCPQEVDWGDVATWVGALSTTVAAGGVIYIARRDWRHREDARKETVAATAGLVLPDMIGACIFCELIEKALPETEAAMWEGNLSRSLPRVKKEFLGLRFSSVSERFDLSRLGFLAHEVRRAEDALRREQEKFMPGTEYDGYTLTSLRWSLVDSTKRLRPIIFEATNAVYEEISPGINLPWGMADASDEPS